MMALDSPGAQSTDQARAIADVRKFWNAEACGEIYAVGDDRLERLRNQARARYELQPYIADFARFEEGRNREVLEVGVGMGADHARWAESAPARLTGVDFTQRAVAITRERFAGQSLKSHLSVADARRLPFQDESFDIVYSWGVIHHSPETSQAADEIRRVLRPGGAARVMIYHKYSLTGYMLWTRYALMAGRPWRSLKDVYSRHLESPGTQAFSIAEARSMFGRFSSVRTSVQLGAGDLLTGEVGQRHRGAVLTWAKRFWPRWLLQRLFPDHGLLLLIEATR